MDYGPGYVQRDPCMSDDEYESARLEAYHEQCYADEMAERERKWREIVKQEKKGQIDNCPYQTDCLWLGEWKEFYNNQIKNLSERLSETEQTLHDKINDLRAENLRLKKQLDPNYEPVKKIGND